MANRLNNIIRCIKILIEKKEIEAGIDAGPSDFSSNSRCDPFSKAVKCCCHLPRDKSFDVILKSKMNTLFSEIEKLEMKELVERQGDSTLLTSCLCHDIRNELFRTSCDDDLLWRFTVTCLKLLLGLIHILEEEENGTENKGSIKHSPNIIGVQDENTILSLVEIVSSIGIFPNFLPGVGRPVKSSSNFQSFLPKNKLQLRKMLVVTHVLLSLLKNKTMNTVMVSRSCNDIIASLTQLRYLPSKVNQADSPSQCCCISEAVRGKGCINCGVLCEHEKHWCETELDYLLTSIYQPFIIKELLILQRCCAMNKKTYNKWFQKIIGQKLSKCLMQRKGVKYVIEGILAGCNADSMNWPRYKSIGKLIAHVPSQVADAEEYYQLVCPQVLMLLELSSHTKVAAGKQYVMVASACIEEMMDINYDLTEKCLFKPLVQPLDRFFNEGSAVELCETQILKCISSIHSLTLYGMSVSEKVVNALSRILHPLFLILCLHQCGTTRKTVSSLLVYLLHNMKLRDCIEFLQLFMFGEILNKSNDRKATQLRVVNNDVKLIVEIEAAVAGVDERSVITAESIPTEKKVSHLLLLLKDKQMEIARGELFVVLLGQLSHLLQCVTSGRQDSEAGGNSQELKEIDNKIADLQHKIQLVSIISALIDTFGYSILQNTPQTVAFIKGILELPWKNDDDIMVDNVDSFHEETVDLAMMLISFLLKTEKLTPADYTVLSTLIPSLDGAATNHSKLSSRSLANDLKVYIATRGSVKPEDYQSGEADVKVEDPMSEEAYKNALKDLTDPLLPTRGHAVFKLSKLLRVRNKYAVKDYKKLLDIFETNLAHDDTYLYLAAVEGLLGLVDVHHKNVLPLLCRKFAQFRDGDNSTTLSSELRMKLGEAIVKSCRLCGEILPVYSQLLLSALMSGVKDPDEYVRASSLSAVGDVCKLLKFSIGLIITEIVSCIRHVVSSDKCAEVRKAAIQVFALMFKGVGSRMMQDIPDAVRDIYRLLKMVVSRDDDPLTKLHASNALDLLDNAVKDTLFPKQTLEKKIQILG